MAVATSSEILSRLVDLLRDLDGIDGELTYTIFPDGIPSPHEPSSDELQRVGRGVVRLHGFEQSLFHHQVGILIDIILDMGNVPSGEAERDHYYDLLMEYSMAGEDEKDGWKSKLMSALDDLGTEPRP